MSAYIIADVTVTNEEQMTEYRVWSSRAMQEHGAEVVVRGGAIEPLEGGWVPQRVVVLKFASLAAARAYYAPTTTAKPISTPASCAKARAASACSPSKA